MTPQKQAIIMAVVLLVLLLVAVASTDDKVVIVDEMPRAGHGYFETPPYIRTDLLDRWTEEEIRELVREELEKGERASRADHHYATEEDDLTADADADDVISDEDETVIWYGGVTDDGDIDIGLWFPDITLDADGIDYWFEWDTKTEEHRLSDVSIRKLAESGRLCEVLGHKWKIVVWEQDFGAGPEPVSGEHVRECMVCGLRQTRKYVPSHWTEWE